MKSPLPKILSPFLVIFFFFLFASSAHALTISRFDISPTSIPYDKETTLSYTFQIKSTEQEIKDKCGDDFLYWEIERKNVTQELKEMGKGTIRASDFLSSGSISRSGSFKVNPSKAFSSATTSESFELKAGCEVGGFLTKQLTSTTRIITIAGQPKGIASIVFNADPKTVEPNKSVNFNFKVALTSKQADIDKTCQDKQLIWRVYMFPADAGDRFENPIKSGAVKSADFGAGKTINQDFSQNVKTLDKSFIFKSRVTCDGDANVITTSDAVLVKSGDGTGTGEKPPPGKELDTKFQLTPPGGFPRTLEELSDKIGGFIFAISIPVAVILIIVSGLMMLTSAGNVTRVNKAKTILWYTILGLAIIFIGKGFITLIQSILGG